ncbi:translocation/assembly module TamB domain-containing protein [Flavitalea antarctica]
MLVLIALILLVWVSIQTTPVQNWLVKQVTQKLSKSLGTTVEIKHVDFSLFDKMLLEGTLVRDLQQDTLLYAGTVKVNINDWFFLKDNIDLSYIGLEDAQVNLRRQDSVWNYRFIADFFSSPTKSADTQSISLGLKKVELSNIRFLQQDGWRGEDMLLSLGTFNLNADKFDLNNKEIHIRNINIDEPVFTIYNYDGKRPDSLRPKAVKAYRDSTGLKWNPAGWDLSVTRMTIKNGNFRSDLQVDREVYSYFDPAHINFAKINGRFDNIRWDADTVTADVNLTTRERSGFEIRKLQADMKMYPEGMEFSDLDLRTPRSRLKNFYAMRYDAFDDMQSYVSKVRMEARFQESVIHSEDIAFFAPALKDWNTDIRVKGNITGSVDNLSARSVLIEAGKNTYLNGSISLKGLPDLNKTYIDFEAKDFKTTYSDAVSFVPYLRTIDQPRLNQLTFLKFKGSFTGFITDFVTYGTIQTNLGTIVSDVNMKFPENASTSYSGNININNFQIGRFLDLPQIGNLSFRGKVNGRGMSISRLSAQLDGTIHSLEFRGYQYQNVLVKGQVAKKLFNGEIISNDPNLDAQLNGLIDFGKNIPEFDFDATVAKADLKKLNLTKDNIDFNGKFRFDFSGDNIDNFLGTARIFEASVFKNGKKLSFDSLHLESQMMDNNKVITAVSNEFDAALVGEFSIKDLPESFRTFLSKYYPSYIQSKRVLEANENFSFVITTKKVDEYLQFVTDDLHGFNFSTITGRINTKENLLDLNAEVPQFNYRNVAFYNLMLKANGDLDKLGIETNIADIYFSDSLHFPGTAITINSSKDQSQVNIKTSANQTLNSASVSANVQTLPKGVKILFNESNFDVNGKNWTIEKNGELVLSESLISADGVKIYNADQEVKITTIPSDIGSTNDIKVELTKINIGDFTPFVIKSNRLEGLLTGSIDVIDPFGKLQVDLKADAEQFLLDDDSIGKVQLEANFVKRSNEVNFKAYSDNKDYYFDVNGAYTLADSTTEDQLYINTDFFKDTRINLLKKYLAGVFSEIDGYTKGTLRITGPPDKLKYLGKLDLRDAQLRVAYTNVLYHIPAASVNLQDGEIDFGSFTLTDDYKNTAQLTRGLLKHDSWKDMFFDFAVNSNKLEVLATKNTGNDPFYGSIFAKLNMTLKGPVENMEMRIKGEPADSSNLYINMNTGKESGTADFLTWKVYGKEMQQQYTGEETNLNVMLDVTANNFANMYVILDELTGDIIKANGHGNLQITAGTTSDFTISGRYEIDRGNYDFNFQSFLHKPFKLRENVGNFISWAGDPVDATIKVEAEYEAENVRFSDLQPSTGGGNQTLFINDNVRRYRGKVLVVANLTEKLTRPKIAFRIELPPGSPLANDAGANFVLQTIQNDENELNKQVAFLIVLNSFGPISTQSQGSLANTAFEGIVVNTISGVLSNTLSNQFSNAFQKLFNDKSLQVNFNAQLYSGTNILNDVNRTGLNIDRTNLNLSLGYSLLNERLTFTFGSALDFGLTTQQVQATRNLQFLPDITAEWKIRKDGKLLLTFFYRDSYNYLSGVGARQNRSGASISYRREFDRASELWKGGKKRKDKPPIVAPDQVRTDSTTGGAN